MKLTRLSLLLSFSLVSLNALTLPEAISKALVSNQDILIQEEKYKITKEENSKSISSFLPKIDLLYSYNNKKTKNEASKKDSFASAKISYNLFNGFKDLNANKTSSHLAKAQAYKLAAKKADIILDVKKAYISYLNLEKNVQSAKSALVLFEKQYKDSQSKYEEGLLAKNDLLKVQVNTLETKQNLNKAKSDLKISKYILAKLMGLDNIDSENIKDLKISTFKNKTYSVNDLENRSEIKSLQSLVDASSSSVSSNRSSFYPKLDASYSFNKYGNEFSLNEDSQNVANLTASWNLYNGGSNNSSLKISKMKMNESKILLNKLRLDIKVQYFNALSALDLSKENLEISFLSLEQSKVNYEIVSNRFNEGVSTATDLIDANYLLTKVRQRYYNAYYSKFLAYSNLDRITQKN